MEEDGKQVGTCKMLQSDFTIRKNYQFRRASKPQFSPPVPEGGVIDPEKLRRPGFVPSGNAKRFAEEMPVHRFVRHVEIDPLGR